MSLFDTIRNALPYVIEDIREKREHRAHQREGRWHTYNVQLPVDEQGRAYLSKETIADLLFEEEIFNLDAYGRKAARCNREIALRRQAYESGKIVSFKDYCRKKYCWPDIDDEMFELVDRLELEATLAEEVKSTAINSGEMHEIWAPVEEATQQLSDISDEPASAIEEEVADFQTEVERLLEATTDEGIRKQIEVIFARNPELKALANRKDCILQLHVVDGVVSVGSALRRASAL